jgi:hypothetical protein
MMFSEVHRDWGKTFAAKKFQNLGPNLRLVAKVQGSVATFTVSGSGGSVSTSYDVRDITGTGTVGLMHRGGDGPGLFANFQVEDAQGKILVKDDFNGPEGTVPNGWKYITGGPNPIKPGLAKRIDAIGWHPTDEPDAAYFTSVREFQKKCRDLGFRGRFFATEIYAGSMYPPGEKSYPMLTSEIQMAKYLVRSLVGHSGLGMEAGPCHPHFTGRVHPQALCQATWGTPTLNPCRPTMTYYMWRNVATLMDDFHPSDFVVNFSNGQGLLHFTFQRGDHERMVSVWMDGPSKEGLVETNTDIVFPGVQASRASVTDIMNGTEQELEVGGHGADTVLKGMLVKDYPVFVTIRHTP